MYRHKTDTSVVPTQDRQLCCIDTRHTSVAPDIRRTGVLYRHKTDRSVVPTQEGQECCTDTRRTGVLYRHKRDTSTVLHRHKAETDVLRLETRMRRRWSTEALGAPSVTLPRVCKPVELNGLEPRDHYCSLLALCYYIIEKPLCVMLFPEHSDYCGIVMSRGDGLCFHGTMCAACEF